MTWKCNRYRICSISEFSLCHTEERCYTVTSTNECTTCEDSVTQELLQVENGTRNGYTLCAFNVMAKQLNVASCWLYYITMNYINFSWFGVKHRHNYCMLPTHSLWQFQHFNFDTFNAVSHSQGSNYCNCQEYSKQAMWKMTKLYYYVEPPILQTVDSSRNSFSPLSHLNSSWQDCSDIASVALLHYTGKLFCLQIASSETNMQQFLFTFWHI